MLAVYLKEKIFFYCLGIEINIMIIPCEMRQYTHTHLVSACLYRGCVEVLGGGGGGLSLNAFSGGRVGLVGRVSDVVIE